MIRRKLPQENIQNQANSDREQNFDFGMRPTCNPMFDNDFACASMPNGNEGACNGNIYSETPKCLGAFNENPYAEVAECKLRSLQSKIDDPNVYAVLPNSNIPPPLPSRDVFDSSFAANSEPYQSPNVIRLPTYDGSPPPPYSVSNA